VDNTTNILRLMLLLSLAIGVVLTRTLLQGKRTRWQQSPFLLRQQTGAGRRQREDRVKAVKTVKQKGNQP
jgi:membrane protein